MSLDLPQLAQLRGERRILPGLPGRGRVQGAAPSLRPAQQVAGRAVLDDPADGRADQLDAVRGGPGPQLGGAERESVGVQDGEAALACTQHAGAIPAHVGQLRGGQPRGGSSESRSLPPLSRSRLELLRGELGQPHLARHPPGQQLRLEPLRRVALVDLRGELDCRVHVPFGDLAVGSLRAQQDQPGVALALDVSLPMIGSDRPSRELDGPLAVSVVEVHGRCRCQPFGSSPCRLAVAVKDTNQLVRRGGGLLGKPGRKGDDGQVPDDLGWHDAQLPVPVARLVEHPQSLGEIALSVCTITVVMEHDRGVVVLPFALGKRLRPAVLAIGLRKAAELHQRVSSIVPRASLPASVLDLAQDRRSSAGVGVGAFKVSEQDPSAATAYKDSRYCGRLAYC